MNQVGYRRGEIILVDLGKVGKGIVGHEEAEKHFCVVLKSLRQVGLVIIVPLSSNYPRNSSHTIVDCSQDPFNQGRQSYALCHQIRAVSDERVIKSRGALDNKHYNKILTVLADMLEI
jgi:mRNA interferase MazF